MISRTAPLSALVLLALAVPAAAAAPGTEEVVAHEDSPSKISSFGDYTVWSRFDPSRSEYRLVARHDGAIAALPVAPRSVPFDVDLGPGRHGHTVAAYSRCRHEPREGDLNLPAYTSGRGCDLYAYDLATGKERKLRGPSTRRGSEVLPSIWRGRIAYARVPRRHRGRVRLYERARGHRARRLPGGHRGRPGPTALDLHGRTVAYTWLRHERRYEGPTSELFLARPGGARMRIVRTGNGALSRVEYLTPAISRGEVTYAELCGGDRGGCHNYRIRRYRIRDGRRSATEIQARVDGGVDDGTYLASSTSTGDRVDFVIAGSAGFDDRPPIPCSLDEVPNACQVVTAEPEFRPDHSRR